jgi:hypothetical protein
MIRREIESTWYFCWDVQSDELERAKDNREMVQRGLNTSFWRDMESYLAQHPRAKLPEWIPSNKE